MSGVVFYLLTCFQGPMHSLRTVNAIVSKTDWIPGHAHMAVLGAFSFFAIAGTYHAVPRMWKTSLFSEVVANWSFWFIMMGGLGFFVTLWIGGFWQGWQWNNPSIPFIDIVVALKSSAGSFRHADFPGHALRLQHSGHHIGARLAKRPSRRFGEISLLRCRYQRHGRRRLRP
jgi:hypothetical protein